MRRNLIITKEKRVKIERGQEIVIFRIGRQRSEKDVVIISSIYLKLKG